MNNKDISTFRSQDLKHHDFVGFTEVTLLKLLNYPKAVVTTSKNLRTAGEYCPLIGVVHDNKPLEMQDSGYYMYLRTAGEYCPLIAVTHDNKPQGRQPISHYND